LLTFSKKATSGINGAGTRAQLAQGIPDSPQKFYEDTVKGARELARPELIKVLTNESAESVHWLTDSFGLDMTVLGRLGGHSFPRTHRGKEQFPGMTITYALMEKLEELCKVRIQDRERDFFFFLFSIERAEPRAFAEPCDCEASAD
jgi:succinate dehydrogenase/fumarate reductase flavoprotein subunit